MAGFWTSVSGLPSTILATMPQCFGNAQAYNGNLASPAALPPDREYLLKMTSDDPRRRDVISARATWLTHQYCEKDKSSPYRFGDFKYKVVTQCEMVRQTFLDERSSFLRSKNARSLQEDLESLYSRGFLPKITRIVCFGLGKLLCDWSDNPDTIDYSNKRTAAQHGAATLMAGIFRRLQESDDTIEIFAQDPAYSEWDISILEEDGISVVDSDVTEGVVKIDENTLLFSVHAHQQSCLQQIVTETTRPAIVIWTDHYVDFAAHVSGDEGIAAAARVIEAEYDRHSLEALRPEDRDGVNVNPLAHATVFIRKIEFDQ